MHKRTGSWMKVAVTTAVACFILGVACGFDPQTPQWPNVFQDVLEAINAPTHAREYLAYITKDGRKISIELPYGSDGRPAKAGDKLKLPDGTYKVEGIIEFFH
ncbi:MAG TPA: hypothetical protein V6C81_23935 [Planktothrix sp.]|jgi:hypothetical protein